MNEIFDLIAAVLLVVGSFFAFAAAVGLVRFPDVLTRLHAATKPQVFGLMIVLAAVAVTHRTWQVFAFCTIVVVFQVLTNPVSGHMLGRSAYRTGQWDDESAVIDELAEDLTEAGFRNTGDDK